MSKRILDRLTTKVRSTAGFLSLERADPQQLSKFILAEHPQTPFVAAVSGRANLVASVTCRSLDELYRYVTDRLGVLEGVQTVEVQPIVQRIKQAGTLVDGDRLAAP